MENTLTIYHTLKAENPVELTASVIAERITWCPDCLDILPIILFSQVNDRIAVHINIPLAWSRKGLIQYVEEVYTFLHDLY